MARLFQSQMTAKLADRGPRAANEAATSLGEFASVGDAYYCVVSWKSGMIDALAGRLVRGTYERP